jgi:hypothetical protein
VKKGLLIKIILAFLLVGVAFYLYLQFGWTKYTSTTYGYSIEHPISWKYYPNKNQDDIAKDGWYFGTGHLSEHSGQAVLIGMSVTIYDPKSESWKTWLNQLDESMKFRQTKKTEMVISGSKAGLYELPTILYVGPIEHSGKAYYFTGDNNQDVKKMLSTFKFI